MDYKQKLLTVTDCKSWIKDLCDNGKDFHFDDNVFDIPCFSKSEATDVKERVKECFELLEDPFEYLIKYST
jgi:hypothetical protein